MSRIHLTYICNLCYNTNIFNHAKDLSMYPFVPTAILGIVRIAIVNDGAKFQGVFPRHAYAGMFLLPTQQAANDANINNSPPKRT